MVTDFKLNGVRAHKHQASGTKITEDGKYVEKEYMENGVLKKFNPKIGLGNNGLRCILNKQLGLCIYPRYGNGMLRLPEAR